MPSWPCRSASARSEELVEQLTWAQLGRHHKPIVLLNVEGFGRRSCLLLQHMHREQFIRPDMDVRFITRSTGPSRFCARDRGGGFANAPDSKADAEMCGKVLMPLGRHHRRRLTSVVTAAREPH